MATIEEEKEATIVVEVVPRYIIMKESSKMMDIIMKRISSQSVPTRISLKKIIEEVEVESIKKKINNILIMMITMLSYLKKKQSNIKRNLIIINIERTIEKNITKEKIKLMVREEAEEVVVAVEKKSTSKSLEMNMRIKNIKLKGNMIIKKISEPEEVKITEQEEGVEEVEIEKNITKAIRKELPEEISIDTDIKRTQNLKMHQLKIENLLSIRKIWAQKSSLKKNPLIGLQPWKVIEANNQSKSF